MFFKFKTITLTVLSLLWAGVLSYGQCDFDVEITISPEAPGNVYCPYDIVKFSTGDFDSYQWYYNFSNSNQGGTPVSGATESSLEIDAGVWGFAYFYVEATQDSCTEASPAVLMDSWVFLSPVIIHEPQSTYCNGDSTLLTAGPGGWESYQWYLDGEAITGATESTYWVKESGTYVLNASPSTCPELTLTSGVGPTFNFVGSPVPVITQEGNVLHSSSGPNYQWYLDGQIIDGATEQTYEPTESGLYTVRVSGGGSGCAPLSAPFFFTITSTEEPWAARIRIAPNPATESLEISNLPDGLRELELFDATGKLIRRLTANGDRDMQVDVAGLAPGIYVLRWNSRGGAMHARFVKQ